VVAQALRAAWAQVHLDAKVARASQSGPGVSLELADRALVEVQQLLVATGRRPVTQGLDPEAGEVELDARGFVRTDSLLRTSAPGVYPAGDVTGRALLTHAPTRWAASLCTTPFPGCPFATSTPWWSPKSPSPTRR
jgi:pyruvate/2-oxoglutarate dehydrogenase complex dihydrolipoamide dehydrogenase (E3) component